MNRVIPQIDVGKISADYKAPVPVTIYQPRRTPGEVLSYIAINYIMQSLMVWWLLPIGLSPFLDVDLSFWQALALVVAVDMLSPMTGMGIYQRRGAEWGKERVK